MHTKIIPSVARPKAERSGELGWSKKKWTKKKEPLRRRLRLRPILYPVKHFTFFFQIFTLMFLLLTPKSIYGLYYAISKTFFLGISMHAYGYSYACICIFICMHTYYITKLQLTAVLKLHAVNCSICRKLQLPKTAVNCSLENNIGICMHACKCMRKNWSKL